MKNRSSYFAILLNLFLAFTLVATAQAETNIDAVQQVQPDLVTEATGDDPLDCIDPWTGVHLTSMALSIGLGFTPFKAAAVAADGASHWAEVELKHCDPKLEAPPNLVLEPSSCTAIVEIPLPRSALEQLALDKQIIELILDDPGVVLPPGFRQELTEALSSEYGHLANEVSGSYSNLYFVALPFFSTANQASHWGDLGVPDIYHFNSDVEVVMRHPGNRINIDEVELEAGRHTVSWTADTTISGIDLVWIPDLSGLGAASKTTKKKAAKKTWKETVKGWFKAAQKATKDVYTDIAKNQAKKTKKKLAAYGKKKLAEKARDEAVGFVLDSYFLQGYTHGRTTVKYQRIYVIDKNAPQITGNDPVTVEALEPGGVSSGSHIARLKQQLNITDDCAEDPNVTSRTPAFWPLSLQEDGSTIPSEIEWTASDNGAAPDNLDGVNSTTVTQQVSVVDTKPPILVAPPPVILEATANDVMTVSLGTAQVFDVADLRPTISNDGPDTFTQGVYRINWTATDFSGNVSEPTKDTVQIVNLKEPGTNVLPTANRLTGANAVDAISYEPVPITVTGQDGDPQPDPLWFSIENQPENGFFIAPLYPYFIDDFRMSARYSPWIEAMTDEDFAWQIASEPGAMNQFMRDLCSQNETPHPSIPVKPPADLPHDFVSWNGGSEKYMAVDDDGFTYIYDRRYTKCDQNHQPQSTERLSVWDADGLFVGELDMGDNQIKDINFDLARGQILVTSVTGTISSSSAHTFVQVLRINKDNRDQPVETIQHYRMRNEVIATIPSTGQERMAQMRAESAALDSNGVLYAIGRQPTEGMVAAYPNPADEEKLIMLEPLIYSHSIRQSIGGDEFNDLGLKIRYLHDVAVDSQNNVYVSATFTWREGTPSAEADRIYKFSPATVNSDGTMSSGELIGWLGKCDSGPNCDYINGRSVGYNCTNETCFIDEGESGRGDRQGQFNRISSIAIDPNDVLYATDVAGGVNRVQRFSPEGYVAGEARATGDGDGFVLGDFRTITHMAVNRGSFYILDGDREIVHIFDAAVIHGIDEASAWVEYQSENNFVGTDRFTFSATDGFRNSEGETLSSPPATVEVNVTRNFRPPEATAGLAISVTEDTPTPIVLEGYDIDGDLDTLTFEVTSPPADGTLSGTPPNLTYTPRQDYDDEDSLTFTVSDGRFTSAPEEFRIGIVPVNDAPTVMLTDDQLTAGAGYPFSVQALAVDPEVDDDLTVIVDWGDGTVESEGAAEENGLFSGPVINRSGIVTRTILANHTYASAGAYNLSITVIDPSGASDMISVPVTVEAAADLAIRRNGSTSVSPTRLNLSYELLASNLPPSSGGVTATGVQISETLGAGLTYRLATTGNGSCDASGQNLLCTLDDLAPDALATVRVVVDVDPATAVGSEIAVSAGVSAVTADPIHENNDADTQIAMLADADFLVDSPIEGTDATLGDGLCATTEGICTLRAAIQEANALAGKQSIALPRDVYMLNLDNETIFAALYSADRVLAAAVPTEDAALSGDLDITDDLEIRGLGADETEINANAVDRVFEIHSGVTVSISGVSISGGKVEGDYGGGIYNAGGNVTLTGVSINANQSVGGGGIANRSGGTMAISASSISGNDAGGGSGGGLLNEASTMTVDNVTISGNRAGTGGGIQVLGDSVIMRHVTMVGNSADSGGAINNTRGEELVLSNTIVAGNSGNFGPVCGYVLSSAGHNLFDDLTDCTVLGDTSGNIIDPSFSIETMTVNAASTYSHLLAQDSRAVNNGSCLSDLAVDQRGVERPQGGGCDIGAIEFVEGEIEEIVLPTVTEDLYLPVVVR